MGKMRLDIDTADRILTGLVDPADAPPGYEAAVALLTAARTPSALVRIPAIATRHPAAPFRSRRRTMLAARSFPRIPILAAAVVLGGASGAAYAAGLPAAASSTARNVLQSLGVTPGAKAHTGSAAPQTHGAAVSTLAGTTAAAGAARGAQIAAAASDGRSHAGTDNGKKSAKDGGDAPTKSHGHGSTISALAHSTSGTAGAKGATISAAASGGKSHAGQHGHNGKSQSAHGHGSGASGGDHGNGHGHSGS
jgi:hypothetical protein